MKKIKENLRNFVREIIKKYPNYNYYAIELAFRVIDELHDEFKYDCILNYRESYNAFSFTFDLKDIGNNYVLRITCIRMRCLYGIFSRNHRGTFDKLFHNNSYDLFKAYL